MFKIFDEKIIIEKVTEGELIRPSLSCFVLIQSGSIELEVNGVRATSKSSDLILFSPMKMYKLIHRSQNLRAYFILYKQEALNVLSTFPESPIRKGLEDLVKYVTDRKY